MARRVARGPLRERAQPGRPARAGHLPRGLRARARGDAARIRADRPLLPQRAVPQAAARSAGGADRALPHPVPGRLRAPVPGIRSRQVQPTRPGRADGESRGSPAARLPAPALSFSLAAPLPAFRRAVVRRLRRRRGLVGLGHLVEEEQRVLAVALRLERHADLEQRVGGFVGSLVVLDHLLELDDGVVPLLLRVVRLAQPVLRVRGQFVLRIAAQEVLEQLAGLRRLALIELLAGQVVEGAAVRRVLLFLLLHRDEQVHPVQRLLVVRRGLLQRVQLVLDDLQLATERGEVVLVLLHVHRQVGAALARGARELVERVLQRLGAHLVLLPIGGGGVGLLLDLGLQGGDVLPHLLALLGGGDAGGGEQRDQQQSLHSGLRRDLDAAILRVCGLVVTWGCGPLLAIADGLQLRRLGPQLLEIFSHGVRPALSQGEVVLGRAALVGVAGDHQAAERRLLQALEGVVETLAGLRREGRVVEAEVDGPQAAHAGGAGRPTLRPAHAIHAGLPRRAVRVGGAGLVPGAAPLRTFASPAAIRVGRALRETSIAFALHPLPAVLVPRALELRHADGVAAGRPVRMGRAIGIVAAFLAEPVDADLPVIGAVGVRLALRVLRFRTARGSDREAEQDGAAHDAHLTAPWEGVKERELLEAPQTLQLVLPPERRGAAEGGLGGHQRERAAAARVAGSPATPVRGEAGCQIVGDAGVQGAVGAAEKVDAPHRARSVGAEGA